MISAVCYSALPTLNISYHTSQLSTLFFINFSMKKWLTICCAALLLFATVQAEEDEGEKKKEKESVGTVVGIDLGTTYSW